MTRYIFALFSCGMILLCVSDACGQHRRGPSRGYSGRGDDHRDRSSKDSRSSGGSRKPYRFKTAHERLPKGIPVWFIEKDANQDGQVMMSEFATRWSDRLVEDFRQFDRNGDGVVTPKECLAARAAGAVYSGGSGSEASSSTPSTPRPSSTAARDRPAAESDGPAPSDESAAEAPSENGDGDPSSANKTANDVAEKDAAEATAEKDAAEATAEKEAAEATAEKEAAEATVEKKAVEKKAAESKAAESKAAEPDAKDPSAAPDVEIPAAYMKHAISYIRMYDKDGNGSLTTDEWEQMRKSPKAADLDGDGSVTPREFALSIMKR